MSSRPLRVLQVIARLNVGGTATHVALLASRLDTGRFESRLATGTPGAAEGDMLELRPDIKQEIGSRLVEVPGLGPSVRATADLTALRALSRVMREFRPDLVHTHTAKAGAIGRVLARLHRVPVVVHTFHGTVFQGHFGRLASRAIAGWERVVGGLTDQVLAVSPAVAADLAGRSIAPGRVRVVPLGLDLDAYAAVPPLSWPLSDAAVVTMVARLVPVKDVPLFLDAMRLVRARRPDVTARIIGDGPLATELKAHAPAWATFLGHRSDLPHLLETSGVVVQSSRSEGSPVALIEALAAGRPVVAVPVGGMVDLLQDRGGAVMAESRTAEAVASSIERALTDRAVADGATAGRAAIVREFGAARLIADMEYLYTELWQGRSRG